MAPHPREHPEPLWREITGRVLRRRRHDRGERLVETAERAGVSSQYLSELERGRKDASSELLAAVAGALDLTLLDLTHEVAAELARRPDMSARLRPVRLRSVGAGNTSAGDVGSRRFRGPMASAA